jgi:hypothetical protein
MNEETAFGAALKGQSVYDEGSCHTARRPSNSPPSGVIEHIVRDRPSSRINAMDRQVRYFYFGPSTNSGVMACEHYPDEGLSSARVSQPIPAFHAETADINHCLTGDGGPKSACFNTRSFA